MTGRVGKVACKGWWWGKEFMEPAFLCGKLCTSTNSGIEK